MCRRDICNASRVQRARDQWGRARRLQERPGTALKEDVMRQGLRNGIPGEGNSQKKGNEVTMGMGWLNGVTRHGG